MLRGPLDQRDFRGQFSGHETFPLRYGWLKKVVDALSDTTRKGSRRVFDPDLAMAHFGVGKNMVASMKHWSLAAGVIEANSNGETRVSDLGRLLFADGGLDPYMEHPASLWAIHWKIAGSPHKTTTWFWAFNHYDAARLDREALSADLIHLYRERGWPRFSKATIRRDVDCFFRTYVVAHTKHGEVSEDSLECPLAELELVTLTSTKGSYEFRRGPKPNLPDGVFNFALAEFWQRDSAVETLSVETLTYEPGSPGRTFKLDEESVVEKLARIDETTGGMFRWSDTAGLRQVLRTAPDVRPLDLLQSACR
ncbi:MAG: DUF4007 family protein [Proteobacteria bacterium]|nr:DUF4007 family protein [Pseudomonadota bacterium]